MHGGPAPAPRGPRPAAATADGAAVAAVSGLFPRTVPAMKGMLPGTFREASVRADSGAADKCPESGGGCGAWLAAGGPLAGTAFTVAAGIPVSRSSLLFANSANSGAGTIGVVLSDVQLGLGLGLASMRVRIRGESLDPLSSIGFELDGLVAPER